MSQYDHNTVYTLSFNVSEKREWVSQYKKIWKEIESQLFQNLATESIKVEGKYTHRKLKKWKERIKTNATAVSKIDSVYKQGKNYHPQIYVEE